LNYIPPIPTPQSRSLRSRTYAIDMGGYIILRKGDIIILCEMICEKICEKISGGWRCCEFILDEYGHRWFLWANGEYYREPP
jgi:hypothetical protein